MDSYIDTMKDLKRERKFSPYLTNGILYVPIMGLYDKGVLIYEEHIPEMIIEIENDSIYLEDGIFSENELYSFYDFMIERDIRSSGKYKISSCENKINIERVEEGNLTNIALFSKYFNQLVQEITYDSLSNMNNCFAEFIVWKEHIEKINELLENFNTTVGRKPDVLLLGPDCMSGFRFWIDNVNRLSIINETIRVPDKLKKRSRDFLNVADIVSPQTLTYKPDIAIISYTVYFEGVLETIPKLIKNNKEPSSIFIEYFNTHLLIKNINDHLSTNSYSSYFAQTSVGEKSIIIPFIMISPKSLMIRTGINPVSLKFVINNCNTAVINANSDTIFEDLAKNKYFDTDEKYEFGSYNISYDDSILLGSIRFILFIHDPTKTESYYIRRLEKIMIPTIHSLQDDVIQEITITKHKLVRIGSLGNGNSCLIHSLMKCVSPTYQSENEMIYYGIGNWLKR